MRAKLGLPLALLAACSSEPPAPTLAPPEPGLAGSPRWLTFTCVRPGCDTELAATVTVVGGRDLAVKRIVLSDDERTDITLLPGRPAPFILKVGETFQVAAKYVPTGDPRLGDVDILLTYTDASADESPDRVKAGELRIPIVRRLVGEPTLRVSPPVLDFGPVLPGTQKTLPLHVENVGFGNVGVVVESVRTDVQDLSIGALPPHAILPMESFDLDVTFAPQDESYTAGFVTVRTADPAAPTPTVPIVGTSIPRAKVLLAPERGVDFGEVAVGRMDRALVHITNQGAEDLTVSAVEAVNLPRGVTLDVELPRFALTRPLPPLGTITATVTLVGNVAGPIDARVRVTSNDVFMPTAELPILALITEPNISVTPLMLDFGRVPRGWTTSRPVEVVNTGYGDLTITGVSMVLGSSQLYTLRSVQLPLTLRHDQRAALEVEFRSEVDSNTPFSGRVSVDSNDPDSPFVEVAMVAVSASCLEGCPIANGTPTCSNGTCAIESCNVGFYDTDGDPMTGCECAEVNGRDHGAFCAEATDVGTLPDNGSRANVSGIVSTADDVDMIRFFAQDESQFLSDDYDVRIRLESADPGIEMCIYRHDIDHHESACILEGENCTRSYRHDGGLGREDGADFTIKIRRNQSTAPSCTRYTVFMSNG